MQLQAIATKLNHFYDWTNVDSDSSYLEQYTYFDRKLLATVVCFAEQLFKLVYGPF
jgi:hypothetical protein